MGREEADGGEVKGEMQWSRSGKQNLFRLTTKIKMCGSLSLTPTQVNSLIEITLPY